MKACGDVRKRMNIAIAPLAVGVPSIGGELPALLHWGNSTLDGELAAFAAVHIPVCRLICGQSGCAP